MWQFEAEFARKNYLIVHAFGLEVGTQSVVPIKCKRILTEVNGEGAPLHGRRVKVPVVHVQVPRADCLRSQTVEQGNFGSAGHANCKKNQSSLRSVIQSFRCRFKLTPQ